MKGYSRVHYAEVCGFLLPINWGRGYLGGRIKASYFAPDGAERTARARYPS